MARTGGWRRAGSKQRFRYVDARGKPIVDEAKLARIETLVIPPAWKDVWISPRAGAKLQATGVDKAGRRQYLYHPEFRAQQEQAKYDKLIRFAEALPELRASMAEHMERDTYDRLRVSAIAVRLINQTWFRPGSERYAKESRTYGVTTLTRRHISVRGNTIAFSFRGKHKVLVRTAFVDSELAEAVRDLLELPGGRRVFRYDEEGTILNLHSRRLNDYIQEYLGEEFSAKDFRTWGGTLLAAIALAGRAAPDAETEAKRTIAGVMKRVAERLGNTPAVTRASYVSPAVVEQYLDGRTIEDFRPQHLRIVTARDIGLDLEEQALLSLLRSWRIRRARAAA
ncbi:MAG: DNA topoisomerase IB [Actinomycetota bacterium]|nr:DNA topoisomerase IB [Actinomycetota bacterium]